MAKVLKVTKKVDKIVSLPDGNYTGTWGGYSVEVKFQNETYILTTDEGVRGINIPVVVNIKGNDIIINTLKN